MALMGVLTIISGKYIIAARMGGFIFYNSNGRAEMKKIIIILYLFAFLICITGCNSASAKNTVTDKKKEVTHEIKYNNKGTKSEGRSGFLKINGYLIPDTFLFIVVDGNLFKFYQKRNTWGDDGYFPSENEMIESIYPSVNKNINIDDLTKGWSEVSGRYLNVPSHWIFVKWDNGSAVISPEKIDDFIKIKSLKIISRNIMFGSEKMKKRFK
jgi:hypothetical protein